MLRILLQTCGARMLLLLMSRNKTLYITGIATHYCLQVLRHLLFLGQPIPAVAAETKIVHGPRISPPPPPPLPTLFVHGEASTVGHLQTFTVGHLQAFTVSHLQAIAAASARGGVGFYDFERFSAELLMVYCGAQLLVVYSSLHNS